MKKLKTLGVALLLLVLPLGNLYVGQAAAARSNLAGGLNMIMTTSVAAGLLGAAVFVNRRRFDPPVARKIKITFLD